MQPSRTLHSKQWLLVGGLCASLLIIVGAVVAVAHTVQDFIACTNRPGPHVCAIGVSELLVIIGLIVFAGILAVVFSLSIEWRKQSD